MQRPSADLDSMSPLLPESLSLERPLSSGRKSLTVNVRPISNTTSWASGTGGAAIEGDHAPEPSGEGADVDAGAAVVV